MTSNNIKEQEHQTICSSGTDNNKNEKNTTNTKTNDKSNEKSNENSKLLDKELTFQQVCKMLIADLEYFAVISSRTVTSQYEKQNSKEQTLILYRELKDVFNHIQTQVNNFQPNYDNLHFRAYLNAKTFEITILLKWNDPNGSPTTECYELFGTGLNSKNMQICKNWVEYELTSGEKYSWIEVNGIEVDRDD